LPAFPLRSWPRMNPHLSEAQTVPAKLRLPYTVFAYE
jgi:hypothetical protein